MGVYLFPASHKFTQTTNHHQITVSNAGVQLYSQMDHNFRHGVAERGPFAVINVSYGHKHNYYCIPGDCIVCICMHAVKKGRRLENKKILKIKK